LNLDAMLLGDETQRVKFDGCRGGAAELWTIQGGSHIPTWTSTWPEAPWGFLMAHPKP
jgi:polyhydroxybutyrate depolymerase